MADKIKKIKLGSGAAKELYDIEGTHSINGYTNGVIEDQTVTFANVSITTAEINSLFAAKIEGDK